MKLERSGCSRISLSFVVFATVLFSSCYRTVSRAPNTGSDLGAETLSGLILEEGTQRVDFSSDSERRWEADTLVVTVADPPETRRYVMEEVDQLLYRDLQEVRTGALIIFSVVVGFVLAAAERGDTSW